MNDEIQFKRVGDRIKLEMSKGDWDQLLLTLGYATGAVSKAEGMSPLFWSQIRFVNKLNQHNPDFVPYEVPLEHQAK